MIRSFYEHLGMLLRVTNTLDFDNFFAEQCLCTIAYPFSYTLKNSGMSACDKEILYCILAIVHILEFLVAETWLGLLRATSR